MTVGGSQQLRLYRRARRDGATVMTACVQSGVSMAEARMIEVDDAKNPPPPEAFELLGGDTPSTEENDMGRAAKKPAGGPINGEVIKPDFDLAVSLYRNDIKPAQAKVGEFAQEQSTAYKAIKKTAHVEPNAARAAFRLDQMEEAKRDDWLRSFSGLLRALKIFMPRDLVDVAQGGGTTSDDVVPLGDRPRPQLATVPKTPPPADDSDLAGGDEVTGDGSGEALPEIEAGNDAEREAEAAGSRGRGMKLKRIIECEDRREFGKLSREQVDYADKITVGGTVVKNRPAAAAAAR